MSLDFCIRTHSQWREGDQVKEVRDKVTRREKKRSDEEGCKQAAFQRGEKKEERKEKRREEREEKKWDDRERDGNEMWIGKIEKCSSLLYNNTDTLIDTSVW